MTTVDAAVVGGGPAGCSAAITLARAGARVVLLEAGAYPRHKVCGEFLSPECEPVLEALGASASLRALGPARMESALITAPDGTARTLRLPGVALGISRSALDDLLARQAREAGADVREGTRVDAVEGNLREGFRLSLRTASGPSTLRAHAVIAAHGRRGALDRALRRPFLRRRHPFVALKSHFHGPPLPGRVELHAFPGGYCGISEVEGGLANVCLLARETAFRGRKVPDFLAWIQAQNPCLREWLSRAQPARERWMSIAQVPFARKGPLCGDLLMAGDAAALIAPLAGDGIAMALHSGRLAGSLTASYLEKSISAEELRRRYSSGWRREFRSRLALGLAIQALMLRPRLLGPALRLTGALPSLGNLLVAGTRGAPGAASPGAVIL